MTVIRSIQKIHRNYNKSLFSQYGPAQACSLTGTSESQRPGQFVPFQLALQYMCSVIAPNPKIVYLTEFTLTHNRRKG